VRKQGRFLVLLNVGTVERKGIFDINALTPE